MEEDKLHCVGCRASRTLEVFGLFVIWVLFIYPVILYWDTYELPYLVATVKESTWGWYAKYLSAVGIRTVNTVIWLSIPVFFGCVMRYWMHNPEAAKTDIRAFLKGRKRVELDGCLFYSKQQYSEWAGQDWKVTDTKYGYAFEQC